MKKTFISTFVSVCIFSSLAPARTIKDSLVDNLNCSDISIKNIYSRIRPEAFSSDHHMPIKNWGFRSGVFDIAACWGMSSTQRKFFYLLRLNENQAPRVDVKKALDMVRGTDLDYVLALTTDRDESQNEDLQNFERTLTRYSVVPLSERTIAEEFGRNSSSGFLDQLMTGITYYSGRQKVFRNLKTEIERSQELHFFRARNIGMGAGSGPLTPQENRTTLNQLKANISAKHLSLVNLRLSSTSQHIVIPKSYTEDAKGNVWLTAYDSNQPEKDQLIYYAKTTGHFYSPQIMGSFIGDHAGTDYSHPLGVFIVDEEEREFIDATLVSYYQNACK